MSLADEPLSEAAIAAYESIPLDIAQSEEGRIEIAKALRDHRELYAEWRDILQAIEGGLGVMTATPAKTIREHGVRLMARVRKQDETLAATSNRFDELSAENTALDAKVAHLEERQLEHLTLIQSLSQTVPLESEVREALAQRGTLLAEIGTLRSQLAAAKASDEAHGNTRMQEFTEYKRRRNEQHDAYDVLHAKVADLEKQIAFHKDRSVALHQVWFGIPGAFTPEMLAVEHERMAMALNESKEAKARAAALLARVIAFGRASSRHEIHQHDTEEARKEMRAIEGALFEYAADLVPDEDEIDATHEHAFVGDDDGPDCELCGHGRQHYLHSDREEYDNGK